MPSVPNPMFRSHWQDLARIRIRDAKALLNSKRYCGSYYFSGLAVECLLKACIAKRTKEFQWPNHSYAEIYKHDPVALVKAAELEPELNKRCKADPQFDSNWKIVQAWKVDYRYCDNVTGPLAHDMFAAIVSKQHGVLQWLRHHW